MFAFSNVMNLFPHELARLSRGRLALMFRSTCTFNRLFGHDCPFASLTPRLKRADRSLLLAWTRIPDSPDPSPGIICDQKRCIGEHSQSDRPAVDFFAFFRGDKTSHEVLNLARRLPILERNECHAISAEL